VKMTHKLLVMNVYHKTLYNEIVVLSDFVTILDVAGSGFLRCINVVIFSVSIMIALTWLHKRPR